MSRNFSDIGDNVERLPYDKIAMSSQWENFLKNRGTWRGSFCSVTLDGEILDEVPSILSLTTENGDLDCVKFRLRRFESGGYDSEPTQDFTQDFRSLGRHLVFAETGFFSKGVMWFTSMIDFIAEFGFVDGDRRLRMVQVYGDDCKFKKLVFIREFREGSDAKERPALTPEQLVGTWEGEAKTYRPDFEPPTISTSRLSLRIDGDIFHQSLELPQRTITSTAQIKGKTLLFDGGRQITLLPDGGSMNVPVELPQKKAFFVETGWLVSENVRHRIMRNFDDKGQWESSVFITEKRVA